MHDPGSKSYCVRMVVQGVPVYGVVDSSTDISIMGGKKVAAAAKLRKKDFSPQDQVPHNYDRSAFHLDRRVNLDVEFLDKTMNTPIDQMLLSSFCCRREFVGNWVSFLTTQQCSPSLQGRGQGVSRLCQAMRRTSVRYFLSECS